MYHKAINKLITSINSIYKKSKREEITIGVARKYGLSLEFKQFQKELNKLSQKESSKLSKEMQNHYIDKYVETTGKRRPLKKAKEKVNYPWSGMNFSQRIIKNSQQINFQVIQTVEKVLRKGGNKPQVVSLLLDIANKYTVRRYEAK